MPEIRLGFIHPFQLRLQRGIEVYLWNLTSALAHQGIQVDILTWDGKLEIPEYARVPGVNIHKVPTVRYFQAQFAVPYYVLWLLKGNYQHVFVHFAGYGEGPALRIACLVNPLPFSIVFHFPFSQVPQRYREFKRWNFQRDAQHLIGVSQATASEVEQWAGRPCTVIGHGVDTQQFHPDSALREQVRQELGLGQDVPVLITVAALEERKGVQYVIRALPKVLKKKPDTRYLIIGEGPYLEKLSELVNRLLLQKKVLFLGFQINVAPYLAASDIALLLSYGEASSISILEYCATGLPVITSTHSPFKDTIKTSWGQMVPEQDAEKVSQAIINLLSDDELRYHRGAQGRDWVIKNSLWTDVAKEYKELIA